MTTIEQLRADIETLKQPTDIFARNGLNFEYFEIQLGRLTKKLATLEAEEAAKADPWWVAKQTCGDWEKSYPPGSANANVLVGYVRYLEAENRRLEAELAKRPVVYMARNGRGDSLKQCFTDCLHKPRYMVALFPTKEEARWHLGTEDVEPYTGEQI